MPGDQNDPANQATVAKFRTSVVPTIAREFPSLKAYVSGDAANALDTTRI